MVLKSNVQQLIPEMTTAERRIATVVLADYPFSGLGTIQQLAEKAQVSAPSITRFVAKLGCAGYQEFQRQLIEELKESAHSPVDLRYSQRPAAGEEGFLSESLGRVLSRLEQTRRDLPQEDFDAFCSLLADPARSIYVVGGRVSHGLAHVMATSLTFLRGDVHLLPSDPEQWPYVLQGMRRRDVLVVIDFRRYQKSLERLAELATTETSSQLVLITDQWLSPISRYATRTFALPIAVGTVWDSYAVPLALIEAVIGAVSMRDWDATRSRIAAWERLRLNPLDPATPILSDRPEE